jgi:hypothetical protein
MPRKKSPAAALMRRVKAPAPKRLERKRAAFVDRYGELASASIGSSRRRV